MGNAGPVFQFWKSNELFKQVTGIVKLNWSLVGILFLALLWLLLCYCCWLNKGSIGTPGMA